MNSIKVQKDGTVEINIIPTIDTKLQFNDLVIQYLRESNIIVLSYDETPANVLYVYSVINNNKPVTFKCKSNFPFGLYVFEINNMELA